MEGRETFEERVGDALDALFDGARVLTGEPRRAEDLVVSVVVEASRAYGRYGHPEDFRKWIVGRLVRHCLEYRDSEGEPRPPHAAWRDARVDAPGEDSEALEALLRNLSSLDRTSPDRLGELIRRSIGELPLRPRAALWLVSVMDFGYADSARILEVPTTVLREELFRARRELQGRLAVALQEAVTRGGSSGASRREEGA